MARKKRILRSLGGGVCEEEVTETFTHRQTLDDGTVIVADPANRFWRYAGCSWYGEPPKQWDESKAILADYVFRYEWEADYS